MSIPNSVHPAIAAAQSSQAVDSGFPMDHMILMLQPSPTQQAALAALLEQQQDPKSANFHKFLTPAQFGAAFGASAGDLNKITTWLTSSGFNINEVSPNNLAITFSGTAAQVESTFNTQIRKYVVNGQIHYANATAPQIPSALSQVVQGFVKLNDFHSTPLATGTKAVTPQFTSATGAHYLVPADYAVIYDLNPLFTNGFTGAAQSVAIVGRSNVNASDLATFRTDYGLPSGTVNTIFATGTDPGVTGDNNTLEATLDVEWASAVAPRAAIDLVLAASTATTDGLDLAAQYAVNHNVASILSVSYSVCEATANNTFYNNLWQQAATEGISVFVSAGDSGAAACDTNSSASGTFKAVNAICSTPYNTCVGGTMFNDTANPGAYWQPGNNAVMGSAISYIPEEAWNESALNGGTGLVAGGGGESGIYLKPYWQIGLGVPTDGHRDIPDVSLTAAQHDGYMIYYNGSFLSVAGTSAATPAFAGIIALVNQKVGGSQGNINQSLYQLAAHTAATFHDITSGNNSVPGIGGYSANTGYDLVSGLGSVDATQLANNWTSVTSGFTLTESAISVNASPGVTGSVTLSVTDLGTFTSPVTLTVTSVPVGVVANFAPGTITGGGTSVLTMGVAANALSGTYPITVTATGGNITRTVSFNLVAVVVTGCTLGAAPASLTVVQSQAASTKLVCGSAQGIFGSGLNLTISGAPAGVTTSFTPAATLKAGTGVTTLAVNAASTTAPGTYTLVVTATLPNSTPAFSTTLNVPLTVNAPSTFTVTTSATTVSFPQGSSGSVTLTSLHSGSFNSAITFQTSGLPSSVAATLTASSVAAPGDGMLTITLQALSIATPASYTMTVLALGGGLSLKIPIIVQVTQAPAFVLTTSTNVLSLRQTFVPTSGPSAPGTASVVLTTNTLTNNFNAAVAFSVTGLPTGVTAAFSSATLAAPGSGSTTLTLTASATATTGISTVTVSATGGTITRYINIKLILTPSPNFSLSVNYPAYTVMAGSSVIETVTATPLYGYNSNVQLTATTPAGISAVFAPTIISGAYGTSRLTLQTVTAMSAGTYPVTVTATDAVTGITQSAQVSLTVGSIATTLNPTSISLAPSASTTMTITTVATSYTGNVVVTLAGIPAGVSYVMNPTSILGGSGTATATILASSTAQAGSYLISVNCSAGGVTFTTTFTLTIT